MFELVVLEDDEYEQMDTAVTMAEQRKCHNLEASMLSSSLLEPQALQPSFAPCSGSPALYNSGSNSDARLMQLQRFSPHVTASRRVESALGGKGIAEVQKPAPSPHQLHSESGSGIAVLFDAALQQDLQQLQSSQHQSSMIARCSLPCTAPVSAQHDATLLAGIQKCTPAVLPAQHDSLSVTASETNSVQAGHKRRVLPSALFRASCGTLPQARKHTAGTAASGSKDAQQKQQQQQSEPQTSRTQGPAFVLQQGTAGINNSYAGVHPRPVLQQPAVPAGYCDSHKQAFPGGDQEEQTGLSGLAVDSCLPELPLLDLPGVLRYASTPMDVEWHVDQMLAAHPKILGFDMEWRVSYSKGVSPPKVALIQLAYAHVHHSSSSSHHSCRPGDAYVSRSTCSSRTEDATGGGHAPSACTVSIEHHHIGAVAQSSITGATPAVHIDASAINGAAHTDASGTNSRCCSSHTGSLRAAHGCSCISAQPCANELQTSLPAKNNARPLRLVVLLLQVHGFQQLPCNLVSVLENASILKAGVGITGDAHKLKVDWGVMLAGAVDLSELANARVLYHRPLITTDVTTCKWSLAGLVRTVLRCHLPKERSIRCGDWEARPLSYSQQQYAALDAFAGLQLYHVLMQLVPRELAPTSAAAVASSTKVVTVQVADEQADAAL